MGVENTLNETNGSVGMAVATLLHWPPLDNKVVASKGTKAGQRRRATNQREAVVNIDNAKGRPVSGLVECERLSTGNPRDGK